jgi:hypothetical protein
VLLPQLRRIRWAVRATLLLGVAASVLANILHALDNPISQAIAAWPPVALLLTVELISRVPVGRRFLAATRLIATAIIAGIAAWVSYWHMVGVAARYGEVGASPYLLPLSVDGLIVVASICLVELGGRIAALEHPASAPSDAGLQQRMVGARAGLQSGAAPQPAATHAGLQPGTAPQPIAAHTGLQPGAAPQPTAAHAGRQPASVSPTAPQRGEADLLPAPTAAAERREAGWPTGDEVSHIMVDALPEEPARSHAPDPGLIRAAAARTGANPVVTARADGETPSPLRRSTAAALAEAAAALPRSTTGFNPTVTRGGANTATRSTAARGTGSTAPHLGRTAGPTGHTGASRPAPAQRRASSARKDAPASSRSRRTPAETVALAARIKADRPAITEAELAAELGISPSRWRTVRREAA